MQQKFSAEIPYTKNPARKSHRACNAFFWLKLYLKHGAATLTNIFQNSDSRILL